MYHTVSLTLAMLLLGSIPPTFCSTNSATLTVRPIKKQLEKHIDITCEDLYGPTADWAVMSNVSNELKMECGLEWGTLIGGVCRVSHLDEEESGGYWCESKTGQIKNVVYSTVIYALEGGDLAVFCKNTNRSDRPYWFYKGDRMIAERTTDYMIISNFSVWHEGFYRCGIRDGDQSSGIWIALKNTESRFMSHDGSTVPPDMGDGLYKCFFLVILLTIAGFYALCMWIVFSVCVCFLYKGNKPGTRDVEFKNV